MQALYRVCRLRLRDFSVVAVTLQRMCSFFEGIYGGVYPEGDKNMKITYASLIGAVGGVVVAALGGWDYAMQLLIISMCVDYISGILVAAIWHKSNKSKDGSLESRAGFKGLVRKGMMLLLVLVAHHLDLVIHTQYVRDAMVIGFSTNEILSILENLGLMGIQYPKQIVQALEVLKKQPGGDKGKD